MTSRNDAITIANRYLLAAQRYGADGSETVHGIAEHLMLWHVNVEPLRLDLLAHASEPDLVHDVAGILRNDSMQSARYALAYHPLPKEA